MNTVGVLMMLLLINVTSVLLAFRVMRPQPQVAQAAEKPFVRLPRGYEIGRAWRRYVHAVLELREARPEEARGAVAAVSNGNGEALNLLSGRAAQQLRAAETLLDGALRKAGRPDLQDMIHRRAWRAAVRLWSARGYPW